MAPMTENRSAPRISVQRRNRIDPVTGQLGTGILAAPDVVLLTPETVQAIADSAAPAGLAGELEIVLGPHAFHHPPNGSPFDGVVERRSITELRPITIEGLDAPAGQIAQARLSAPSAYLPVVARSAPPEREALQAKFFDAARASGDVWQALESVGAIPAGFREPPGPDWLRDAEQVLVAGGAPGRPDPLVLGAASGICCIFWWWCSC